MSNSSDPRVFFAAVQTLLGWQRSSLALMAFGFVIERFSLFLTLLRVERENSTRQFFSLVVGIALILLGSAVALASSIAFRRFVRDLPQQDVPPGSWASLGTTVNVIVAAIGIKRIRGKRFVIPRAEVAREVLPEILRSKGAREVVVAPAYRTVKPKGAQIERIRELIASGAIDLVTFTSSSTVTNFCDLIGAPAKGLKAAAIGPITAATAQDRGLEVVVRPGKYTVSALTAAIAEYYGSAKREP